MSISGAKILKHEVLAEDVVRVSYDNGVSIVINYTDRPFTQGGIRVNAMSFTLTQN